MATLAGMTAEQAVEAAKSFSFEQLWAVMNRFSEEAAERQKEFDRLFAERQKEAAERKKESDEQFKELRRLHAETEEALKEVGKRHAETERVLKETAEQMKENERKMAESSARTDRKLDRLSENVGGLNNSLGSIIETLVAARLWEKFEIYRLTRGFQRVPIYDENKRGLTDIDILLSNTKYAIAVEVKTSLNRKEYVDRHLERMELIRRYPPAEVAINNKRVMGAMAGGIVILAVMEYAHQCGFYVLELSGETVRLADTPAGFEAKVW
jgi:flagellar biosynthesis GTPase FlhF